jgi:uncharacterized LabA/DUF88 family protein
MANIAFIDGQNLHLGTFGTDGSGWKLDHKRFRTYLSDKYGVAEAYYFLGFVSDTEQDLYTNLQKSGYILEFREHSSVLKGKKKGNVDCDIVFSIMKRLVDNDFDKIFLVSGDGDYIKIVDYLVKNNKFGKILFPNAEFASSLYNKLGGEFFDALDSPSIKAKIEYSK